MVKIIPNLEQDRRSCRVSVSLLLNDFRSFAYQKLPRQPIKLSVLKLNGSSFEIQVSKNATVAELKHAVEEVFSCSPTESQGWISWSHVWGHFCLCYGNQKLLNDKAFIQNMGIKDGDQLQFIRHMSIDYKPAKQAIKKGIASNHDAVILPRPNTCSDCEEGDVNNPIDDVTEKHLKDHQGEEEEEKEEEDAIAIPQLKLVKLLKGWFSCSKMWRATRKGFEVGSLSSKLALS